jgi:hypothetical protein
MLRTFALAVVLLSVSWIIDPLAHAQTPATAAAYTHDPSYARVSRAAIQRAAREFRVNFDLMLAIAQCESGLHPDATNPYTGAAGLYQFMWPTFTYYSARLWWAPKTWLSPYNPRVAARTAAYMISIGLVGQWTCSYVVA